MTAVLDHLRRRARLQNRRLLLAEADDERVVRAAERLARERLAEVGLIGPRDQARQTARTAGAALHGVELLDSEDAAEIERTAAALRVARGDRLPAGELQTLARDPLFQAASRVARGEADCFVAGAKRTTADVLRAALWLIGLEAGVTRVSSFFFMEVPARPAARERTLLFADCGVLPDPDAAQLAEIGILAAEHFTRLTGEVAHTAFLSFSTRGSAAHARVDKVREATARACALRPDLHFDGELQADAALDPEVARRKAPGSVVAGHANVLVFPDLDSGNIGYKLVQRLAGAEAYGPILMGLARQANDLSRGCSTEDIAAVAVIACALARPPAGAARAPSAP